MEPGPDEGARTRQSINQIFSRASKDSKLLRIIIEEANSRGIPTYKANNMLRSTASTFGRRLGTSFDAGAGRTSSNFYPATTSAAEPYAAQDRRLNLPARAPAAGSRSNQEMSLHGGSMCDS